MDEHVSEFVVDGGPARDAIDKTAPGRRGSAFLPGSSGGIRSDRIMRPTAWERRYEAVVLCCDLLCVLLANLLVTVGYHSLDEIADGRTLAVMSAVPLAVMASLALQRAWDPRVLGSGAEEYRRVSRAYICGVAALAIAGYAWGTSAGQSWVFGALFLAWVFTVVVRKILRSIVFRLRKQGRCLRSVLVAGGAEEVHELILRARGLLESGWKVEGICLAANGNLGGLPIAVDDVPVLGTDDDIVGVAQIHRFEAVTLLPSECWPHVKTRQLSWDLEEIGADLLIAPVLMDVVGPRLHTAPLASLPLLQMSAPSYSGPAWVIKNLFDRVVALLIVVMVAPVFAIIALGIRFESPGPTLIRQTRVGRDGKLFTMYKFRSDPRATRFDRFIRRYSCDELPQLFNVVKGDMSLVGPRPPLECEVAKYGEDGARRRLLVKPGLTGLWQVSGRSDHSWEESVRADLHYVENWTFAMDLSILRRTIGAVLRRNGAY